MPFGESGSCDAALRLAGRIGALAAVLSCLVARGASAVGVPDGFVVENAFAGITFDTPTSIAFLPDGSMLVGEKAGRVKLVQHGVVNPTPLWSHEDEVLNINDRGLLGVAADPHYSLNHYVYFLYTVDPDSDGAEQDGPAFGRLTRYQVSFTDSTTLVPGSRAVLLGADWSTGPPSGSPSHAIGALRWGDDGTLLVSMGDGASYTQVDAGGLHPGLFEPGRIDPYQDIGAFRARYVGSLGGKILRLDPATGHGLPSNPYWDGDPTSARSRVWEYGLRNPFRFAIRPGSGSTNPAAGDPGTLYVGDVGWDAYEELNIAPTGGLNFGWPCNEGPREHSGYRAATPSHCGCDSSLTPGDPAPEHVPDVTWHHLHGDLSNPLNLVGNCSVSGAFYEGTRYPPAYRDRLFFADFGQNWIRLLNVDAADHWTSVEEFAIDAEGPVDMALNPANGDLYYVSIYTGEVRRIRYTGDPSNNPPVAVASVTPVQGFVPLHVTMTSAGTSDADGDPLQFGWSFGDGGGAATASATHVYTRSGNYRVILSVEDGRGGIGRDTVTVVAIDSLVTFPTTGVLDDFNRGDGPVGGAWVPEMAGLAVSDSSLDNSNWYSSAVWGGALFGPNQEVYVTLANVSGSAPETDLMLKAQGLVWSDGYLEVRYDATQHKISINSYTPGAGWAGYGSIPMTLHSGDVYGARADSTGLLQVFVNGLRVGNVSVASWPYATYGGHIGLLLVAEQSDRYDDFGGGNVVYSVNAPPHATLLSPADHMFYAAGDTIVLVGTGTDDRESAAALQYHWQVDMHHNTHIHPASVVLDGPSGSFVAENHDDGTGIHLEVLLIETDGGGLRDTARAELWPEVNLQPASLALPPQGISSDGATPFSFTLHNHGRMPAPFSHWQITLDTGVTLAQGDTLVPPLGSVVVQGLLASAGVAGPHALRVTADSLQKVPETDESDNALVQPVNAAPTGALDVGTVPFRLALSGAYPNPTGGSVSMALELPRASRVSFQVLDVQGRVVWSLGDASRPAGRHLLRWPGLGRDGALARPGVYLARVRVDGEDFTRRIALIH